MGRLAGQRSHKMPELSVSATFPGEFVIGKLIDAISLRHHDMNEGNRDAADKLLLRYGYFIADKLNIPELPKETPNA